MNLVEKITAEQEKEASEIAEFGPGDTVRVHQLIQEGSKERVQVFEGVVIRRNGGGSKEMFTVRKISHNVGVERIFPVHSPRVKKVEVKQRGSVRRARLYYLRERTGKAARIKEARRKAAAATEAETATAKESA